MSEQRIVFSSSPQQHSQVSDSVGSGLDLFATQFGKDRLKKYGWGMLRFIALFVYCFQYHPLIFKAFNSTQISRLFIYAYFGSGGAIVNTRVLSKAQNVFLLIIAILLAVYDLQVDDTALIFISKTFAGDFFAKKLDTVEFKTVGIFTVISAFLYFSVSNPSLSFFISTYGRIWLSLFFVQLISEYGDNHWERITFFRHRYAFEVGTILILLSFKLSYAESLVICLDLVSCFFYRVSNFSIVVFKQRLFGLLSLG